MRFKLSDTAAERRVKREVGRGEGMCGEMCGEEAVEDEDEWMIRTFQPTTRNEDGMGWIE